MSRTVLVHMNVEVPDDDDRTVPELVQALEAAIEVGSDDPTVNALEVLLAEVVESTIVDSDPPEESWTNDEVEFNRWLARAAKTPVGEALNKAADGVLEAVEATDEGVRDIVNLIVNVGRYYLDHPEATLDEAIVALYRKEPKEVLGWCRA